jgi:acetolactate synthase-1/2/3 large subunit
VDITKMQFDEFEFSYKKCTNIRSYNPKPTLNIEKSKGAAELINNAKKPFILFGQGVIF